MSKIPLLIDEFRQDGRKPKETRKIEIEMDITKNSTGSAMVTLGETKVIAWIHGPRESKSKVDGKGSIKCYFSQAPFSGMVRKKNFKRDLKMREFSKILKEVFEEVIRLELYSRSDIIINCLVLQNDGNYKSASISAITLALINAGLFIKDLVIGMSVGCQEENILYDLQLQEEKENIPILNVAYLPHSKKFIYTELVNAKTPYAKVETLMKEAEVAANRQYEEIEKFLKYSYIK